MESIMIHEKIDQNIKLNICSLSSKADEQKVGNSTRMLKGNGNASNIIVPFIDLGVMVISGIKCSAGKLVSHLVLR